MNVLAKFFCFVLSILCVKEVAPFDYDLHLFSIPGTSSRTMICFHGYGSNYQVAEALKNLKIIDATLVSFNFPDHDLQIKTDYDPCKASFGTINELLPAFYVLKKTVVDAGLKAVDLYGYSAGGGTLVNLIACLNTPIYDVELNQIGISPEDKGKLLRAIQKGVIVLDTPLKSIEEIIDLRGSSEELEILAKNYRDNHLRPIDSLESLKGLSLDVIVHFQKYDEVIFNRDDDIYIEKLKRANTQGTTSVIVGNDGGHLSPHVSLWQFYAQKIKH